MKADLIQGWGKIGAVAVMGCVAAFFGAQNLRARQETPPPLKLETEAPVSAQIVAHVIGAVGRPGVVRLKSGARVQDAIEAAGGAWSNAALGALNLAAPVEDGSQIVVPKRAASQEAPPTRVASGSRSTGRERPLPRVPNPLAGDPVPVAVEPLPVAGPAQAVATPAAPKAASRTERPARREGPKAAPAGPVSLNDATSAQLQTLPGVGPKTAEAILAYRKERGGFSSVEELMEVKGIGPKKLEKMRPYLKL